MCTVVCGCRPLCRREENAWQLDKSTLFSSKRRAFVALPCIFPSLSVRAACNHKRLYTPFNLGFTTSAKYSSTELGYKMGPRLPRRSGGSREAGFTQPRVHLIAHLCTCTIWGVRLWKMFCKMVFVISTGGSAVLQLPCCCPSKQV